MNDLNVTKEKENAIQTSHGKIKLKKKKII